MSSFIFARDKENSKLHSSRTRTKSRIQSNRSFRFTPIKSATKQILRENENRRNKEKQLTAKRHKKILTKTTSRIKEKKFLSPSKTRNNRSRRKRSTSRNYFRGTVCSPSATSYTKIFYSKRKKKVIKEFCHKKASPRFDFRSGSRSILNEKRPNFFLLNDENVSINNVYKERVDSMNRRKELKIAQKKSKNAVRNIDKKLKNYYSKIDQIYRKRGFGLLKKIFSNRKHLAFMRIMKLFKRKKIKISISKRSRDSNNDENFHRIKERLSKDHQENYDFKFTSDDNINYKFFNSNNFMGLKIEPQCISTSAQNEESFLKLNHPSSRNSSINKKNSKKFKLIFFSEFSTFSNCLSFNFETESYSPRKSTHLKVKLGLANLENKFRMAKFGAFNEIKLSSIQNKFQRFSFSLGRSMNSSRARRYSSNDPKMKNSLKMIMKKLTDKMKIGFLKLKLNRMKQRNNRSMSENNHLFALAMCTKELYESKMRKVFRLIKYAYLIKSEILKGKAAELRINQESTFLPNSESKSSFSFHQSNLFTRPSNELNHYRVRTSSNVQENKNIVIRNIELISKKKSSKSISIKSEQVQRDSISSMNFNFEMKSQLKHETREKKSIMLARGLKILRNLEKKRGTDAMG